MTVLYHCLYLTFSDELLAVGSHGPYHIKAEVFSFKTGKWTKGDDYISGCRKSGDCAVARYDMLFISELSSFVVIGGYDGVDYMATIAKFKKGKWSDAGQMKTARSVNYCSFCSILLI